MKPPVVPRFGRQPVLRQLSALAPVLPACLGLGACGDPLVPRELIQDDRVLGARVELLADASRAQIAPGQTARLRWLVASPSGPPALGWAFSLCAAAPVSRDLPRCAGPSFAHFASPAPSVAEPQFEFAMPDASTLGTATQITANGRFCRSGNPLLQDPDTDWTNSRCPGTSDRPLLATMGIFVGAGESANLNPSFASVAVSFDDADWPTSIEPSAQSSGCLHDAALMSTVRADGARHHIALDLPKDLAEPLSPLTTHSATSETITLSHYTTAGDLERAFSAVDLTLPAPQVAVPWTAPATVPSYGQLVRFYFVLRDGRGGSDWTTRALCVVP
jgi:hypothetical protein